MCAVPGDPHALGMTRTTEPAARDIAGLRRAGTCLLVASGLWGGAGGGGPAGGPRARASAGGLPGPESEPAVGSWPVFAVAAVGFAMPAVVAGGPARQRGPGRRASLLAAGFLA